jgi:hypothetical protein
MNEIANLRHTRAKTLPRYNSVADPQNSPTEERRSPTGQPMSSVVAQNFNPLPWAEQHALIALQQHRWVAGYRFAVRAAFCPGTCRRGLREAGGDHAGALWTVHAAGGACRGCSYGGCRDQRRQRHGGCRHGQQ